MLRWLLSLVLALILVAALGVLTLEWNPGFSYPAVALDHSQPRPQGDFYRGAYLEVSDTNPFTTTEATANRYVLQFTHDPLYDRDPISGDLRPALAESHEISEDRKEIVFVLRETIQFSDGSPLSMADVAFTMALGRNSAIGNSAQTEAMREISEFEILDDRRFKVTLRERHFAGLSWLAPNLRIIQERFFRQEVERLAKSQQLPVPSTVESPEFVALAQQIRRAGPATGPYEIGRDSAGNPAWQPAEYMTLVQNPHSWRRKHDHENWNLAGIHLRFITEPTAQLSALKRGEIDWYTSQNEGLPELLEREKAVAEKYEFYSYDPAHNGPYLIIWNHRRPGLSDPKVRRALTMLFDRKTITEQILHAAASVPSSWFKPGSPELPSDLVPLPFDPQAAAKLLAKAGYGRDNPLELSILAISEWDLPRQVMELAMPSFEEAGVRLSVPTMPFSSVMTKVQTGDFDGFMYLQGRRSPVDPYAFFRAGDNYMGYGSEEVERILTAARKELDPERRRALYQEFSRVFHRDQPVTLLAFPLTQVLLHKRFQGVQLGPLGLYPEGWWVAPEDQIVTSTENR
ncbi:MAG: ABC transporter substrate-binding protein [Planctomycetota bacterium]|jgi:peptide/nickel transport system substrate-binding protein